MKIPNSLIGAAGEYLVAAELSQRGWLATVTIKNAPGTDVLAQHYENKNVVAIQSKTTRGATTWLLGKGDETPTDSNHEWVVLVRLAVAGQAQFWVMPRNHVALFLWVNHRKWLLEARRDGGQHRDNPMRQIHVNDLAGYAEAWHFLEGPTSRVETGLLPAWAIDGVRDPRIGLRSDHPLLATLGAVPVTP